MRDPKQTSERLQAIIAESKRVSRETQALIDPTRELSEADARLARALSEVGADLNEASVYDNVTQLNGPCLTANGLPVGTAFAPHCSARSSQNPPFGTGRLYEDVGRAVEVHHELIRMVGTPHCPTWLVPMCGLWDGDQRIVLPGSTPAPRLLRSLVVHAHRKEHIQHPAGCQAASRMN
jgi:hypothetical protein